ncbi:kinase-like domain-containing protein, partial [Rhexocercosporidium sp. MPI-PUGE-AT-0058]
AVIKHFPANLSKTQYNREFHNYTFDSIARSPFVRSMIDLVGHDEPSPPTGHQQPKCMVFEWMDTDLWQLPASPFRSGSELPRIVARFVLEALAVFDYEDGVHTDVNPNTVFLSGVNGPSPVVKLGDLGNCKSLATKSTSSKGIVIRAPEVWKDIPITPKADIWSLGVTVIGTLAGRKTIFGPADKIVDGLTDHWSIAKLMRHVDLTGTPDPSKTDIVDEFALAEETFVHPQSGLEERFIKVGSIRHELEKVEGPIERGYIDFIESLLVVNPTRRPSAMEALQHPWLKGSTDYDSDWSVD